jgi:hypothetical protein
MDFRLVIGIIGMLEKLEENNLKVIKGTYKKNVSRIYRLYKFIFVNLYIFNNFFNSFFSL